MPWPALNVRLSSISRVALPFATLASLSVIASTERDPSAAAEGAFLAVLATGVLAAIQVLDDHRARWTVTAAVAMVATFILVSPGVLRGSTMQLLACAGLIAAGLSCRSDAQRWTGPMVAATLGAQLLLRPELLIPTRLDLATLTELLLWPVLGGLALGALATTRGVTRAALTGVAVLTLHGGLDGIATATLAATAAAFLLEAADTPRSRPWRLAGVVLAAVVALSGSVGLLIATGAAIVALRTHMRATLLLTMVALVPLAITSRAPTQLGIGVGLLLVLVPTALRFDRRQPTVLIAAMALAAAAGLAEQPPTVAIVLLTTTLAVTPTRLGIQAWWGGTIGFGTVILAGYPWVREAPLSDWLALLGLGSWRAAGTVALGIAAAAWLLEITDHRFAWRGRTLRIFAASFVCATTVVLLLDSVPRPSGHVALDRETSLSPDVPGVARRMDTMPVLRTVTLDTSLVRGVQLAADEPVAAVQVLGPHKQILHVWRLYPGTDTAEWASHRPDVAARMRYPLPTAWQARVAPSGEHLALRFRSRLQHPGLADATWVRILRSPRLPADTRLVIHRVEVRP